MNSLGPRHAALIPADFEPLMSSVCLATQSEKATGATQPAARVIAFAGAPGRGAIASTGEGERLLFALTATGDGPRHAIHTQSQSAHHHRPEAARFIDLDIGLDRKGLIAAIWQTLVY